MSYPPRAPLYTSHKYVYPYGAYPPSAVAVHVIGEPAVTVAALADTFVTVRPLLVGTLIIARCPNHASNGFDDAAFRTHTWMM
jgi:hypothetical protein